MFKNQKIGKKYYSSKSLVFASFLISFSVGTDKLLAKKIDTSLCRNHSEYCCLRHQENDINAKLLGYDVL